MSLLRAKVSTRPGWWEVRLLDLDIVADGASESDMLRELEYALTAEYHLALKYKRTPFANLARTPAPDVSKTWQEYPKRLRQLNLPVDVRAALAVVLGFGVPTLPQFNIQSVDTEAA